MFWVYLYKAKTDTETSHRTEATWVSVFYRETYFPGFLSAIVNSFSLPGLFTYHENLIFKHLSNELLWFEGMIQISLTSLGEPSGCSLGSAPRLSSWGEQPGGLASEVAIWHKGWKHRMWRHFCAIKAGTHWTFWILEGFYLHSDVLEEELHFIILPRRRFQVGQPPPSPPKRGIMCFLGRLSVDCPAAFIGKNCYWFSSSHARRKHEDKGATSLILYCEVIRINLSPVQNIMCACSG